jgi:hypothetical protein
MTAQQWYALRLHNLQTAGWAVLLGQKSVEVSGLGDRVELLRLIILLSTLAAPNPDDTASRTR